MKKLFGQINITWKFLIIFSIIIGIIVGGLNKITFLKNTSFQDIAIVLDMWIIIAIFIIVNCKNWKEAVLKCFIFFLISQPLIYFTELIIDVIAYKSDFYEKLILYFNNYYIHGGWLKWTILTIPGSYIAYQIKKDNYLSAIILSVATLYLTTVGTFGLINTFINNFPYHLLNGVICLLMSYYLIFLILNNKKNRIISIIITSLGIIIGTLYFIISSNNVIMANESLCLENKNKIIEFKIEDENVATAYIEEDRYYINVSSSKKQGETKLILKDENNEEYIYIIKSNSKNFEISLEK